MVTRGLLAAHPRNPVERVIYASDPAAVAALIARDIHGRLCRHRGADVSRSSRM
jgi:hypothetical protein